MCLTSYEHFKIHITISIFQQEKSGSERLSDLPMIIQPVSLHAAGI